MKRRLLLFFAVLMAALPLAAASKTWSFEWNKSYKDGSQGFYNFGTSYVEQDVYTTEINGLQWSLKSEGSKKYAITASGGQAIGTGASSAASKAELWTSGFEGKITAVRVTARTVKDENPAELTVSVNGQAYKYGDAEKADLNGTATEYAFSTADAQEGKLSITLTQPDETKRGVMYIKKIEVDYETVQSAVTAPTFSLAEGTYDTPQQLAISVEGAAEGTFAIYYTTDGSNPKTEEATRQLYTQPIEISATTQIKAVAKVGDEYSNIVTANYKIRRSPELKFYKTELELTEGDEGYADLINPNKVSPVSYTSSAWDVCSVDKNGTLYTSDVDKDETAIISATFAGNDDFLPQTVTLTVTVKAKAPIAAPAIAPDGGTFDAPVNVTVTSDDPATVTIWYSTNAASVEEFENANAIDNADILTVVEGKKATINIKKSCTLYVRAMGYNTASATITRQYVIDEPLKAAFSTDKSAQTVLSQNFDQNDMPGWTAQVGWRLANKGFGTIDSSDKSSAFCGYDSGTGSSALTSPEFAVTDNMKAEFYAYFSGVYLVWGSWNVNIVDTESGDSEQVFDAFNWAQANEYTGPTWNKFSFPLDKYVGKTVKVQIVQNFDGEDLAIDNFAIVKDDPTAAEPINLFEGEKVAFHNLSTGAEAVSWSFPGGDITSSTDDDPTVTYNTAGTYDVTLTATAGSESDKCERKAFIIVSKKAPKAVIGLPEEGYESPFVGVFVPVNVPVTFRDLSENAPTAWHWEFQNADKTTSEEQNPTVTFTKKGTVSVGLKATNDAGSSVDQLNYAIQAGGAQYVWNISPEENSNIDKVELGWYGNYAGTNWLGIDKFAEKYKAPLADAVISKASVYFASNTVATPDADITLTINAVAENGEPGEVLGTASVKASDIKYEDNEVVATDFTFAQPVTIKKGQQFFAVIGPFPNNSLDEAPYTSDDIAVFCLRRDAGQLTTSWQLVEDMDDYGNGLGTYKWFENTDDPISMAIAPIIDYEAAAAGINGISADKQQQAAVYTIDGRKVDSTVKGGIYVVRQTDGTTRKVLVK